MSCSGSSTRAGGDGMLHVLSDSVFPAVLRMSLYGAAAVIVVLLVRLLLRRAPKVFSYALWLVVLFRLLCPVTVQAPFSLWGAVEQPAEETAVRLIPAEGRAWLAGTAHDTADGGSSANTAPAPAEETRRLTAREWAALVWLAGAAVMAGYGVVSLLRLRRRLIGAVWYEENVYITHRVPTPFVLGLVRPRIFLPASLTEEERPYILLHERYHIKRWDHVVKFLYFTALCIHWFDPFVWLAFALAGRDMEMRCDEAVLRQAGENIRADYAASLLRLATGQHLPSLPLAFGEGDTGGRIRNLLRWRRPRVWVTALAALVCAAVIAACGADPAADAGQVPAPDTPPAVEEPTSAPQPVQEPVQEPEKPWLSVWRVTWQKGDSAEQLVPLTQEQVDAILAEEPVVLPEWQRVYARLEREGQEAVMYAGDGYFPVPPTVLDILTEQCGYTFVTPEDFRGNMTEARLEWTDGQTRYAAAEDLPALQEMLMGASCTGGAAACGFGARLTVTFDDGRTVSVLKGEDSCPSFMFGSWCCATVTAQQGQQFWRIFGFPAEH